MAVGTDQPVSVVVHGAVLAGLMYAWLAYREHDRRPLLHTLGLELRCGLIEIVHVEKSPLVRTWNIVHMQSKMLSPAAEAFRYFMLEQGEAHLLAHDTPLLGGRRS